ncbi:cation transporter [Mucilaginibacter rubeus]|uniref:Cation transporter n=1 Tax=Mucilaginibacter rubeus TaxID=2027860 RepID=A0AAE6JIX6_9SPHI|nr:MULTISPECIES: cation transporter [Mucilaginibacter]QEM06624.1 cation transporter [Mucilaginibacter rubeus]QEM19213.1 cation transporter [Mucilaginibacter gossypii]QTE44243.1 cation transporter [Mucilaginibacter rubeus]QTE50843.1 cation transporter [Mucilaginibacter rubeus]QTE55925.1 cation transporter [Mucilaginibacter rubeus]
MEKERFRQAGLKLEYATLAWNLISFIPMIMLSQAQNSLSLFGFGIDSLIEVLASVVVIWQLKAVSKHNEQLAIKIIGVSFLLLSTYLIVQTFFGLHRQLAPQPSLITIFWLILTALVMFALAAGKQHFGRLLENPVLIAESKVTVIDGLLAVSVLTGLLFIKYLGWSWMDMASTVIIALYGFREAFHSFKSKAK